MGLDRVVRVPASAGTVRVRTTVAAALVVGVAMLLGAVVLVLALRDTLTDEVRLSAQVRAADVVTALASGTAPDDLSVGDAEDVAVQVLDPAGAVVTSSPNVRGLPPVADLRPGESAEVSLPIDDQPFLAVAEAAAGSRTVLVARSLDPVVESTSVVTRLLALGLPGLMLVVAATGWLLVGRALTPVEGIRREVEGISAADLHRRVPQPAGADEIARLASTMNRMLGRLESAATRQRRFVADASHELRTPLTAIRQSAEVALAHPDLTSTTELAETVHAEGLRMQRLVADLLLLASADEQNPVVRRQPVDVDDLVFDVAGQLRVVSDLRIDTTSVSAGRVDGDPAALRRVVQNLADNAARHASRRVLFSLVERGSSVVLTVDDDGPGIPSGDRARVLERFVRLDDARSRDAGGSGLGLAIVAEVVAAHSGDVAVLASPSGGARVEITLPRSG